VASVADLVFADAILLPLCAALSCVGWSFSRFKADAELRALAAAAARECIFVAQRSAGPSLMWRLLAPFVRGWLLCLIVMVAPLVLPFDLEAYLAHHFGAKRGVSGQVDLFLTAFADEAKGGGAGGGRLHELQRRRTACAKAS